MFTGASLWLRPALASSWQPSQVCLSGTNCLPQPPLLAALGGGHTPPILQVSRRIQRPLSSRLPLFLGLLGRLTHCYLPGGSWDGLVQAEPSAHGAHWQVRTWLGVRPCGASWTLDLSSLSPVWLGQSPGTTLPKRCWATEGAGSQAAVLRSASSWLLRDEVEKSHGEKALSTHSPCHCGQPRDRPGPQAQPSAQHQNAERQWPAEARPTGQTPALVTFKVRQGDPAACTGSDQSEPAWLLPRNPRSCCFCRHLGSGTSLLLPLQVKRIPV